MSIENSFIRRQILNQRYAKELAKQYRAQLQTLLSRVADRLAAEPNSERLRAIKNDLEVFISGDLTNLQMKITDDMVKFGRNEAGFVGDVINANSSVLLRVPDSSAMMAALMASSLDVPVGPGKLTMLEALDQFSKAQKDAMLRVISDGMLFGESPADIAKKMRDLAGGKPRYQIEALARTLTNHTSSEARKAFAVENRDAFDGEEWIAVLDSRTTLVCGGRDGQIFDIGKGPYPPAHWNCRSVRVPVLASEFEAAKQKSTRRDFDEWLRNQSDDFQDEYFSQFPDGDKMAKLFRDGKLPIQNFRDEIGKIYTLDELKALHPVAFDASNLTQKPAEVVRPTTGFTKPIDYDKADREVKRWVDESFGTEDYNTVMTGIVTPGKIPTGNKLSAYYRSGGIHMGKKDITKPGARETYRHEFGHHVDYTIGQGLRSAKADFIGAMDSSRKIIKNIEKTLLANYRANGYKSRRRGFNAIREFSSEASDNILSTMGDIVDINDLNLWIADNIAEGSLARQMIDALPLDNFFFDRAKLIAAKFKHAADMDNPLLALQIVWESPSAWRMLDDELVGITGLLDNTFALTKNWGGGHEKSYYNSRWLGENKEIFANTFAAMDPATSETAIELYKVLMPDLYELMKGILRNGS